MSRCFVIVDDDKEFLDAMSRELGQQVELHCFQSAVEAIEFLSENAEQVETVFVDLQMPDIHGVFWQLGGLNVIQTIKNRLGDRAPRVYALTGMDAIVHIHTCLKNGADAFLEKGTDLQGIAGRLLENEGLANQS